MKTDELIANLSDRAKPTRPVQALGALSAALAAALAVCIFLVCISGQVRPNLMDAMEFVAAKAGFSLLLVLAAVPAMLWLARPGRQAGLWFAVGIGLACLAVIVGVLAVLAGKGDLAAALGAGGQPIVFLVIPIIAIPAGVVLFAWCRTLAPTRLAMAGAAAGALSGGVAAAAYALICPVDEAMFVATWYTAAVVLCSAIGAALGGVFLRW